MEEGGIGEREMELKGRENEKDEEEKEEFERWRRIYNIFNMEAKKRENWEERE